MKRVVDEFGNEKFIEVDIEDCDFDDNESLYEEYIDEHGNKKTRKVNKETIQSIKD